MNQGRDEAGDAAGGPQSRRSTPHDGLWGGSPDAVPPTGETYDWYHRGMALLKTGSAAAAAQLLARAAEAEPSSPSIREALARAQYDTGQYAQALVSFRFVAEHSPADDYAQFGWGMAAARLGDYAVAAEHLALAVAMRPDVAHYRAALRDVRATLRARAAADQWKEA